MRTGRPTRTRRRGHPVELPEGAPETLFSRYGVTVVRALPYSPWAKPVGSLFARFARTCENLLLGWAGPDAKQKPEHVETLKRRGLLLTLEQLEAAFASWAWHHNNDTPIGRERDRPPAEYFTNFEPRMPRDTAELDSLLRRSDRRRVAADGLTLDGRRYLTEGGGFPMLVGRVVTAYWSREEPEAVILIHPDTSQRLVVPQMPRATYSMLLGGEIGRGVLMFSRARQSGRLPRRGSRSGAPVSYPVASPEEERTHRDGVCSSLIRDLRTEADRHRTLGDHRLEALALRQALEVYAERVGLPCRARHTATQAAASQPPEVLT